MMISTRLFATLCLIAGCSSTPATDIGDTTVAGHSYHIAREGDEPAAGVSTQLVVKSNDGSKPDAIMGWVGTEEAEGSQKVAAVYDANDGDFDIDVTCPSPLPANAMIWLDITVSGQVATTSIAIK